jgi:hypothetical protein
MVAACACWNHVSRPAEGMVWRIMIAPTGASFALIDIDLSVRF